MLPLEREQDIELSLEPGLYVLKTDARWKEKGNLSYGFLLEVPEHPAKQNVAENKEVGLNGFTQKNWKTEEIRKKDPQ
ncbi:MAG: hypothetical protein J5U19_06780 [Candidatus Methanoperedens sp.]|nr:hypothetical protein [Candidatus Methanoperedens sp.]